MALYISERCMEGGNSEERETVLVRFRSFKDDQGCKRTEQVRMRGERHKGSKRWGFYRICTGCMMGGADLLWMAYRSYGGWQVWARAQTFI